MYLSQGNCAKKTLITKLKRAFPEFAAIAAAERMEELGLINDEEYAKGRLRRILDEKHVSIRYAKQLLRAEGIDSEQVDIAVEGLDDNEYSSTLAIKDLIERRYKQKLNNKNELEKVISALMRKGFSYSEIREVLGEYKCETEYYEE